MDNQHSNSTAITLQDGPPPAMAQYGEMTVDAVVARKDKIHQVLRRVLVEGEHYGTIPGCGDKPTLYKAGAEVLATTFGLAPTFKIKKTDLPNGHREYEIICTMKHIATGAIVGEGVGAATTMETKHRWRRGERLCPKCGKAAIIKGKAEFGGGWLCFGRKGGCSEKFKDDDVSITSQKLDRIENPDPADQYNTVLKMAKKRAQVDCTLTAVGASDILTQDLEDLSRDDQPFDSAPVDARAAQAVEELREMKLEAIAKELIADIADAKTPEEVKALESRFADLPKGSRPRISAFSAYKKRLADVTPPATA